MNLFDIPIFKVALAIMISWAFFAIFCGLIAEAIAQIKAERGRFMRNYLFQQLYDFPNGINWGSILYSNGNIDLLSRAPGKPTNDIDPHLFAETMVDIVSNALIVQMAQQQPTNTYTNTTLLNFKKAVESLYPSDVMSLFGQSLKSAELHGQVNGKLDEGLVYQKLIENLENWYTGMMERMTLWYKKKTRKFLFIIGIILAFFVNVDSVQLFHTYNSSDDARNAIIASYVKNKPLYADTTKPQTIANFINAMDTLKRNAVLPIGFDSSTINLILLDKKNCTNNTKHASFWIWKLIGILISGFAASFGGPFWFDVLKKIYTKKI